MPPLLEELEFEEMRGRLLRDSLYSASRRHITAHLLTLMVA